MATSLYSSALWRIVRKRVLARDGHRCSVARLLGGECSATLHVHHLVPVSEGGARFDLTNLVTACSSHHPMLEALRRAVLDRRKPEPVRCPHRHVSLEARLLCETRIARQRVAA